MTVRTRLISTVVGIAALLVIPSVYSLTRLQQVQEITEQIQGQNAAAILSLGRLQTSMAELDRALRAYVATPDPTLRRDAQARLDLARAHVEAIRRAGYEEQARRAGERVDSVAAATGRLSALLESGRRAEATARLDDLKPLLALSQDSLAVVAQAIDRRSERDVRRAQMISASAVTTVILGLLGTLAAALLLGLWTTGALTSPLRRLSAATSRAASGRFEVPAGLPYDRQDEIGDLSRSFRTMSLQLAELNRLKAEFLSMASHDLKTPINVIGGYAELLETGVYGELTDKQREVLGNIQEQSRHLTDQVNQLLNASRMEAGGFRISLEPLAVVDLMKALQRTFAALAAQKRIDFTVDIEPDAPTRIVGDPDRLRNEALGNLLSNAFKFTPEEGRIAVRARAGEGELRIDVVDSGKGIPAAEIPHIFDKFYQVGHEERRIGSGLGLAIALQVVEAHNGRIEVSSREGRGTTFTVCLPEDQPQGEHRTEALFREAEEVAAERAGGERVAAEQPGGERVAGGQAGGEPVAGERTSGEQTSTERTPEQRDGGRTDDRAGSGSLRGPHVAGRAQGGEGPGA
ncbi:MAG TPA: ATP-binding protein [Longimicrobiales bacterium]|nr:ATP-binding protein [Longimicrobiales bacterium]